jgi:hypothetical protein
MSTRLDHIVVVAHSLAAGSALVEKALGVAPGAGRKHPHMGTHNVLLSLGASVYLEVVAIDPEAPQASRPRWFGLDNLAAQPAARLAAWVASTDDIANDAVTELGSVETMQREGLTWQMTVTASGSAPLSGVAPLLIQRASSVHPASVLPDQGLRLCELRIRHPAPALVSALLSHIGLAAEPRVTVASGGAIALSAAIETPQGIAVLGEANPYSIER